MIHLLKWSEDHNYEKVNDGETVSAYNWFDLLQFQWNKYMLMCHESCQRIKESTAGLCPALD